MWVRNSALVVAVSVVLGLVVITASYLAFWYYRSAYVDRLAAHSSSGWKGVPRSNDLVRDPQSMYARALGARANEHLAQLEATLAATSAMLTQKTDILNERTAECQRLRGELDQTLTLIVELLAADQPARPGPVPVADVGQPESVRQQLEAELNSLRAEIQKSDFVEQEQAMQLDELKVDLLAAEGEISAARTQTQVELQSWQEERAALASAARQALVQSGTAAVPPLMGLLAHERPTVRAWAASALAEMGRTAEEAAPLLASLLTDPNEDVRLAAQDAMAKVTAPAAP